MLITQLVCPVYKYDLKCPFETTMDGITVHNTDNDASAMAEASYMIGNDKKCSFHASVDNFRVVECLPLNRSCFASGDGRNGFGNAHTINIEICFSQSGGERFDEAEENAACYIAYLLKKYNWGIDKVGTHQMRSGKYCPSRTLNLGWQRFLNKVRKYLDYQNAPVQQEQENGGELEMAKVYQNGSTYENVYADTNLVNKIGRIDPREKCEYLSIDNNRPLVRYKVNGTNTYKCGYVQWKGGCK